MLCPRCGTSMNQCREDYRYQESGLGNIWLVGCEVWKCDACRNAFAVLPDARLAAREIARILILQPYRLDSRSIHFCRKLLGMTALQLGIRLGVHRVEVSRWENDRANIDPFNDFKLYHKAPLYLLKGELIDPGLDIIEHGLEEQHA